MTGKLSLRSLKNIFSRITSMTALIALLTAGLVAVDEPKPAHAAVTITKTFAGSTWSLVAGYHASGQALAAADAGLKSLFSTAQNNNLSTLSSVLATTGASNHYANDALFSQVNNGYLLEGYTDAGVERNVKAVISTSNHSWNQLGTATVGVNFANAFTINSTQLYKPDGTTITTTYGYVGASSGTTTPLAFSIDTGDFILLGATNSSSQGTGDSFDTTFNGATYSIGIGVSDGTGTGQVIKDSFSHRGNSMDTTVNDGTAGTAYHSGNQTTGWVMVWVRGAGPTASPAPSITPTNSGKVGATYTSSNGTWTGSGTVTDVAARWQSSTDGTTWTDIAGATNSTYTTVEADAGKYIRWAVSKSDNNGTTTLGSSTLLITTTPAFTASTPTASGTINTAITSYTFAASGYRITYSIASGALPTGVSLNATTGVLSGTPTVNGVYTYTVSATNESGTVTTSSQTLTINQAPAWTANAPTTSMLTGTAYSYTFTASGYPAPTFSVTTGTLPTGMTLTSAGVLSGMPTTVGSSTVTFQASNGIGSAVTVSKTFTVTAGVQATLYANAANSTLTYNAASQPTTTVSTTGGSGTGAVSYVVLAGSGSVCSLSGTTVTAITAGACTIVATKAADANYGSISASVTITINKASQSTLSATATSNSFTYSTTTQTTSVSASGGSGTGATTFSVDVGSTSVCSISSSTVTILTAGICSVTATKAADTNYLAQTAQVVITIAQASQATLTASAARTSLNYNGSTPETTTVSATGGTGTGSITYALAAGSNAVCSLSGTTVTALTAGSCVITATKAADTNYLAQTASVTITVNKIAQAALTISAGSTSLTYSASPATTTTYTVSGGSGTGAVTVNVNPSSSTVCSIEAGTVTILSAGSCVLDATKATDTNFLVSTASVTITVAKAAQTALVATASSTSLVYSATTPTISLGTSGGSGTGLVSFSVAPASSTICSVSGGTLTVLSAGSCLVNASKASDGDFNAESTSVTVSISKADQSPLVASFQTSSIDYAPSHPTTGFSTSGGSGSGLTTYTIAPGSIGVCSISGNTVTALSAGSCQISATKAGDTNYLSASSSATLTINRIPQALFTVTAANSAFTYSAGSPATTTLSSSGGNGSGSVAYTVTQASAGICSVSGNTVTALAAGQCEISATKAGDVNYLDSSASTVISIAKSQQSSLSVATEVTAIDFDDVNPLNISVVAIGGSGLGSVDFAIAPSSATVCSVSGSVVTVLTAGTCQIDAIKNGDSNFLPATASGSFVISKIHQTRVTVSANNTNLVYSASPAATSEISVAGGSGTEPIVLSVDSSATGICSLDNGTVTALSSGNCIINATKAGGVNYLDEATSVGISIQKAYQEALVPLATRSSITTTGSANSSELSYTGGSGTGLATWTVDASSSLVCSISGTTVTAVSVGSCVVNLNKAGDNQYFGATNMITIDVSAALQTPVSIAANTGRLVYSASQVVTATISLEGGNGTGLVWFETTDGEQCTVDQANGNQTTVTFLHAGTCEIIGHKDGDADFASVTSEPRRIYVGKSEQSELSLFLDSALTYSANGPVTSNLVSLGGSSTGATTFSVTSGTCTVDGTQLTATSAGDCSVRATKASDRDYNAVSITTTFTVAKAEQEPLTLTYSDGAQSIIAWDGKKTTTATIDGGSGTGTLSATSSSTAICRASITGNVVTVSGVSVGDCRVAVVKAESANYVSAGAFLEITVIDLPSAPTNVTITNTGRVTNDGTAVDISWTPTPSTGTQASATGYEIQFKSGLNWVRADGGLVGADVTRFTVYPTPWTALYIRVAPVSDYDSPDGVRRNWTNYTGTDSGTTPVAFNIAGQLQTISSPIVAAGSGEPIVLTGTDFDQSKTNRVEITTSTGIFTAGIGRAAVAESIKTVPAVVISPTQISFTVPKVTLPAGVTQLAAQVRVLSTTGVRSGALSFNYIPKKLTQTVALNGLPTSPNLIVGNVAVGSFAALGAIPTATGTANICSATVAQNDTLRITPLAKGKCVVTITAPATPGYTAAPPKVINYTILGATQSITLGPIASRAWSSSTFDVSASTSSNLPVRMDSLSPQVCTANGVTVTMLKSGVCSLKASQAGNNSTEAAAPVTQNFNITKADRSQLLTATINSLSSAGVESPVVISSADTAPTQANVSVAVGSDPLDRVVTLSQREGTVVFTVDPADDQAGRCLADGGADDSTEGLITVTDLGSCKVTVTQPADDRFNAGPGLVIWISATTLNPDAVTPSNTDVGAGQLSPEDTDNNPADPDSSPAVSINLPTNGGTFDAGDGVGIGYNPLTGLLTLNTRTNYVGTFKVTVTSPNVSKKWFTVAKKPNSTCTLTLTVKKDPKLKKSVVRLVGVGCTLNNDGKAALTAAGVQKIKLSYVFNRAYAKTGFNYMGTAKAKTRVLKKVKRTIVLKVGR
jgi:hypothetical protein